MKKDSKSEKGKTAPAITKEEFLEVIKLLHDQEKKDHEFGDFMEKYLDGRFVPMMSDCASMAALKALSACFNDRVKSKYDTTWIDWFFYENDCGEKKMQCYLKKKEYVIDSAEAMYDFLALWMGSRA